MVRALPFDRCGQRANRWPDEGVSLTPDGETSALGRHGRPGCGGILTMKADGTNARVVLWADLSHNLLPAEPEEQRPVTSIKVSVT